MLRLTPRIVLGALAAVALCAATAGEAASPARSPVRAAGATVTLNLQSGSRNTTRAACGIRHHYTLYRTHTIGFNGSVSPSPRKPWRVKVKVKKCSHGRFVTLLQRHVSGNARGGFSGHFRVNGTGSYFARAYFYRVRPTAKSDKQYFGRIR